MKSITSLMLLLLTRNSFIEKEFECKLNLTKKDELFNTLRVQYSIIPYLHLTLTFDSLKIHPVAICLAVHWACFVASIPCWIIYGLFGSL